MKDLLLAIFNIFRGAGRLLSGIRSLIFNIIFLAAIVLVVIALFSSEETVIQPRSILQLKIAGNIVEQRQQSTPFDDALKEYSGFSSEPEETLLQDIVDAINAGAVDSRISALLLDLSSMGKAGMNQLEVIGNALEAFQETGKEVIAAESYYNQDQYYLASHANKVFLDPMGFVHLSGFGLYRLYFREALEKLKINYHVFKVGSFKSALEPFTRSSMSSQDRQQSRMWLTSLWNSYVDKVADQRSISREQLLGYINDVPENLKSVGGNMAELALASGLVDEVASQHRIRAYLASKSEGSAHFGYRAVSFSEYLSTLDSSYSYNDIQEDTIAVIVAQGTIMPGHSSPGIVGSETLSELIRNSASSEHIKAAVLRIDSGGGSAFASETIRQELLEFKKKGKPLIVSMGTFAASGAYWISADADEIWASPDTLTGSIGIFMAVPTFEKLLQSGGVYRDGVGTTNLSGAMDLSQPLSPEVKQAIQLTLDNGYHTFLSIVSEGREIPMQEMETIAQGKVFSGTEALKTGLIDRLGNLKPAIESAASMAGLESYQVSTLQPYFSLKQRFFQQFGTKVISYFSGNSEIREFLQHLFSSGSEFRNILLFRDPKGMYAHCMLNY